jgi:hypothetical protein
MSDFAKLVLDADTKGLKAGERDLRSLSKAAGDTAVGVDSMGFKIGATIKRLVGPAAIGAAVAGFGMLTKSVINTADEISKASQKIGIGTEELSRLRYAADLAGVSFQGLQGGIGILSRNMFAAASGGKEAASNFARLGIEVKNADGSLRTSSQVLGDLADRFSKMPDGAQKTAEAMLVLGRSGAQMIPLLNGGRDALTEAMNEADKFGVVIDEVTGRRAEAFNDNLTRLTGVVQAMATQVAAELLPVLVDLTNWLVRNSGAVRDFAGSIVNAIQYVQNVSRGIEELASRFSGLGSSIGEAGRWVDAIGRKMRMLMVPMTAVADLLAKLGASSAQGRGPMALMTDNMLLMARQVKAGNEAMRAGVGAADEFDKALGKVGGGGAKAASSAIDRLGEDMAGLIDRYIPQLVGRAKQAELALLDLGRARGLISEDDAFAVRRGILGISAGDVSESVKRLTQGDNPGSLEAMKTLTLDLGKVVGEQSRQIADSFGTMADRALQALDRLAQGIQRGDFLSILGGILNIGLQLGGMGLFGSKVAANINSQGSLPARANGGMVSSGGSYLVGERGPEIFTPNGSGFITPNGGGGGGGQSVVVINNSALAEAFVQEQITATAPAIMQGAAQVTQQQMSRQARRRT